MKSFIINSNDAGQRVSKFIEKTVPALPQGLLYKIFFVLNASKLNKKRCQPQDRQGDLLELYINRRIFRGRSSGPGLLKVPTASRWSMRTRTSCWWTKPPDWLVHLTSKHAGTSINRILHYLYNKGEYQPDAEQSFCSLLLVNADHPSPAALSSLPKMRRRCILNQKVKDRELTKLYLCLVHGVMKAKKRDPARFLLKDSQRNQARL